MDLKRRKPVPHEFVLEALFARQPRTRPMFGCLAVYVGEKIVLILRDRPTSKADNGVWLATTPVTDWQVLPADTPDFEESALRACELVLAGDPRVGKIPSRKRSGRR